MKNLYTAVFILCFCGIHSCKEDPTPNITHTFHVFKPNTLDQYFSCFNTLDSLVFERQVNGMVVDTLTYYLVSNEIDTLERSKSTIPGEINEIVHIERKTVLYHNTKVSSPFEVQIWAAEGSGIFEAYVFFFCEDLYYVNFVGNVSFGIGDYSSIGYNPKYTIGTKTFRDVWGNFSAYGDIIIEAEGYTPSFKADSSDLWFDPDYGVLKMIKEQALVLTAVL